MARVNRFGVLDYRNLSHYYGDPVRAFFLGAAGLMLVGAPVYAGEDLSTDIPFIIVGLIVVVALAAITNPVKQWVMMADAIAGGVGAGLYGLWALMDYSDSSPTAFVLRGAIALLFLFAFYFAMKTVRAMVLGQVVALDTNKTEREDLPDYMNSYDELENKGAVSTFLKENDEEEQKLFNMTDEEADRHAQEERVSEDSD